MDLVGAIVFPGAGTGIFVFKLQCYFVSAIYGWVAGLTVPLAAVFRLPDVYIPDDICVVEPGIVFGNRSKMLFIFFHFQGSGDGE